MANFDGDFNSYYFIKIITIKYYKVRLSLKIYTNYTDSNFHVYNFTYISLSISCFVLLPCLFHLIFKSYNNIIIWMYI